MRRELLALLPNHEHHYIDENRQANWLSLIHRFPPFSVAHTAALIGEGCDMEMFRLALALAPTRMLAYNKENDRFHIRPSEPVSSLLFLSGEPVHQIHLRPWRDDSVHYREITRIQGRAEVSAPTIAVLSPYLPWPLSHGGAVRIFNLIQQSARNFNIHLFAFTESRDELDPGPLSGLCTAITLVRKPDFRRVRWASLRPPEVLEYDTPAMHEVLKQSDFDLLQTEFTQLATYKGDILVEHDVTMDLAAQEHARVGTLRSAWNLQRWRIFERNAITTYRSLVVMSGKDKLQIGSTRASVIPNGVDLQRYQPRPETPGCKLLFIGSFRHFPNALAYRFLSEEFWPILRSALPMAELDIVAGLNPELYYPFGEIPKPAGIHLHSFVSDVRPLYHASNLVLIPTPVSAGTNIKALEAMAMRRAILSTSSGTNGLELEHGKHVWIADGAETFAQEAVKLLRQPALRKRLADEAYEIVEKRFDWAKIATQQEQLWRTLLE